MRVVDVSHDGYGDLLVWMDGSTEDVVTLMRNGMSKTLQGFELERGGIYME